jgi:hypothetical protein
VWLKSAAGFALDVARQLENPNSYFGKIVHSDYPQRKATMPESGMQGTG